jgi:hypothetical protein
VIGAISLVLAVALMCSRRFDVALLLCAAQAIAGAAAMAGTVAAAAGVALALNGVALPLALHRLSDAAPLRLRDRPVRRWAIVLAALGATIIVLARFQVAEAVTLGAAVAILGVMFAALRAHALAAPLGLLSAQTGLLLVASAHPHLSLAGALVVAAPVGAALVLAETWLRR